VQHPGRAGQAIQEVAGRARGGDRGPRPFKAARTPARPEAERDDADERGQGEQRFEPGAEAEGGTMIDDELEPQKAAGDGDPVTVAQGGVRPRLARDVSGQRDNR
jgi:hypothetical protein